MKINCPYCGGISEVDTVLVVGQHLVCPFCEREFSFAHRQNHKSRLAFVLLGIFIGELGIHNFYAGYTGRAVAQLLMSVLSFGLLVPVVFIWNLVEVCIVSLDSQGVLMEF